MYLKPQTGVQVGGTGSDFHVARDSQTLTQRVIDNLRSAILSGEFEPGERLIERNLCGLMGVSRTAVREALRSLESEGIIANIPNKGPSVAMISQQEAREIYSIRLLLEPEAIALFLGKMSQGDLAALSMAVDKMELAQTSGDLQAINEWKRRFYEIIFAGCGHSTIARLLRQLHDKIVLLHRMTALQSTRTAAAIAELKQIFHALQAGDAKTARKAAARHVQTAETVALNALFRRPAANRM